MADPRTRERVIELIREMKMRTVDRGCTPAEAAGFAAKVAEWMEKHSIDEAELRQKATGADGQPLRPEDVEVCENVLRTGKRVHNPGMTQVVNALARAMGCRCILMHKWNPDLKTPISEAVYGIVGDGPDADYVCQVSLSVVPSLQVSAALEGREHGYEKAGLVRWTNQYLTGAAEEIHWRITGERRGRAAAREAEEAQRRAAAGADCRALAVVTGQSIFDAKQRIVEDAYRRKYPKAKTFRSRSEYDHTANERGREAGKRVVLHQGIEDRSDKPPALNG